MILMEMENMKPRMSAVNKLPMIFAVILIIGGTVSRAGDGSKRVMIYGDSISFGWLTNENGSAGRFPLNRTWPGVMGEVHLTEKNPVVLGNAVAAMARKIIDRREEPVNTRIVMRFDNQAIYVAMNDSQASNDFIAMLPIALQFRDYSSTEKVSDLPRKLSTSGAPAGYDPPVGDLTYYAPWGNLAIFYRDFGYANGLVSLGKLESGIDLLAAKQGEFSVQIEVAE